jgi:hypothetical protein
MTTLDVVLASELRPGMYICFRTRSLFGFVIRLFCRSPWDHAVLVTGPGEITQATLRGTRTGPLSQFRNCMACANSAEDMTAGQRGGVVAAARSQGRDEYAYPLILVIALRLLGLRWRWLVRACQDRDAVFCSELVAASGQAAVPPLPWLCGEPSPATVRPNQLAARPCMRTLVWDLPER